MPNFSKSIEAYKQAALSLSHTRTFMAFIDGYLTDALCLFASSKGSSTVNTEPSSKRLFTEIVPPSNVTRFFVIAIPSPVLPNLGTPSRFSCSNGRYIFFKNSSLIPLPVSLTVNFIFISPFL